MRYRVPTILLLEDNLAISKLLGIILGRQGYTVLAASNGSDAIRLAQLHRRELDLVLADVMLRNELAAPTVTRLREMNPGTGVLFLSGLTLEGLFEHGCLEPGMMSEARTFFLQKPFLPESLIRAVETLLDEGEATNVRGRGGEEVSCHVRRAS
jgi:two-component system, cell cycle sensor histidine kinase and response regulator CckA